MKLLIKSLVLFFFAVGITGCTTGKKNCETYCSNIKKNAKGKPLVRLQQQWFVNSGFAGELVASKKTAEKYGIEIQVIAGSDQIDTKQMVKSGEAEFGVAGAEQIMLANEKDSANFVIIGVINYKSLACFVSKKGRNILTPKDFIGKKIGTMEGSPVDLIYQVLKKTQNIEIDKDNEIPTGWVTTGFTQDKYDVYPAFINDEPVTFKLQGIDVDIIDPRVYDVNFIGTVYFCKKELVDCCPEIVQSFINSIAEGWELTIKNPSMTLELLKEQDPNIDLVKENESLIKGMDYYRGEEDKVLYTKEETWNKMAEQLKKIEHLKMFNYKATVDNKFITWYHSKIKK